MKITSNVLSAMFKGLTFALLFTLIAFSSNAQQATITNDLDCDIKIDLTGITHSCGVTSQVVTLSPGTHVVNSTNAATEWFVGGELIEVGSCTVSVVVQDCNDLTSCSCTLQAETSFTMAIDCCDNDDPTSVGVEVHQNSQDCQIRVYD